MDLSCIIVNYNLAHEIENCLNSLLEIELYKEMDYEIIVVDNNSSENYIREVEKKFARNDIKFFYSDKNLGFGKACNFGFSKATGKYICFLNPDIIVTEDVFSPIKHLFESDSSIGIIGPKQQTRPPLFDFSAGYSPNILFEIFNLFGMGVFAEGFIVSLYSKLTNKKTFKVNWILGASIFIRADIFTLINGFDKDYFMFFEEVDLCRNVSDLGYKIIYCHTLNIHHIGSVSGKKDYRLYTIRTYSSKNIYISKHYKNLRKLLMKTFLRFQLFSQIFIWSVLFPLNGQKSKQKLKAFSYLLKNKMKYEHRD